MANESVGTTANDFFRLVNFHATQSGLKAKCRGEMFALKKYHIGGMKIAY
jgi:hypothetical protein